MKIKIKKFNEKGNEEFEKFVKKSKKEFKNDGKRKFRSPFHLIKAAKLTETVPLAGEIETDKTFKNAFEYSKYIHESIKGIDFAKFRWDRGLFNWICAAFFPNFFPGVRSGVDEKRVYLSEVKSKWRRHFSRTLWEIFYVYGDLGLCLLYKETNNFSDELETISKSPIMFSSKGIVEAYSDLYFKKKSENSGLQTYKRGEIGDFRNFIDELYQLEINLDIFRMSKNQILNKMNEKFIARIK